MSDEMRDKTDTDEEHKPSDAGAEGGEGGSKDVPPGVPNDDGSALGDTDQHSSANA